MVLAHRKINRPMKQNRQTRKKPSHVWSTDFPPGCQDHSVGKEVSFQNIVLGNLNVYVQNKWSWTLTFYIGIPRWLSGKESAPQCRIYKRCRFNPWVRKISWSRKWQSILVFLPGKSHGQRSRACYSLSGSEKSDTTDCVHVDTHPYTHTHTHTHTEMICVMKRYCILLWNYYGLLWWLKQ